MKKQLLNSQGITLVELLIALGIMSFLSTIIVSHLVSGMNTYQKVNEEISLHDEANMVIQQFEHLIFVANDVDTTTYPCTGSNDCLVTITKTDFTSNTVEKITLGFQNGQAVIDQDPSGNMDLKVIHADRFKIRNGSKIEKDPSKKNHVLITMILEDTKCKYESKITIEKRIPFIQSVLIKHPIDIASVLAQQF